MGEPETPSLRGWHWSKDLTGGEGHLDTWGKSSPGERQQGRGPEAGLPRGVPCAFVKEAGLHLGGSGGQSASSQLLPQGPEFAIFASFVTLDLRSLNSPPLTAHTEALSIEGPERGWNMGDKEFGEQLLIYGCCQQSAAKRKKVRTKGWAFEKRTIQVGGPLFILKHALHTFLMSTCSFSGNHSNNKW